MRSRIIQRKRGSVLEFGVWSSHFHFLGEFHFHGEAKQDWKKNSKPGYDDRLTDGN